MPMSPFVLGNQALCKDLTVSISFLITASLTYDDISFIVEPRPVLAHTISASVIFKIFHQMLLLPCLNLSFLATLLLACLYSKQVQIA